MSRTARKVLKGTYKRLLMCPGGGAHVIERPGDAGRYARVFVWLVVMNAAVLPATVIVNLVS